MRRFPKNSQDDCETWDSVIASACERFGWTIDQIIDMTPGQLLKVMTENGRKKNKEAIQRAPFKQASADLIKELNTLQKKAGKPVSNKR